MSKINFKDIIKTGQNLLDKHSPEILTSIGIAGMISTTVMSIKVTPKAMRLIEDAKEELEVEELTRREIIKTCWKCYIPPMITGVASIACLVGANTVNSRRNAVLATAYKISETTLTEYKNKVVEVLGEEKEKEIRKEIAQDRIERNPIRDSVIITEKGNTLCYDSISGRYFKSDAEKIRKAENVLNRKLMSEAYVSLNDFYDLVGLPFTKIGHELGWVFDGDMIEIEFSTAMSEDDIPCIVLDYSIEPRADYQKLI